MDEQSDNLQAQWHPVVLQPESRSAGRTLENLDLARFDGDVTAVRPRNIRDSARPPETLLGEGDVIVLRDRQQDLIEAEMFLLQG